MARLQGAFRNLTDNDAATFFGTPRCTDVPWMMLIGMVAAQELDEFGAQAPYEPLGIGSGGKFTVARPGYLYAFANDAWSFYDNNRGSVELTVSRLS
jgi:hypothetical protein